MRHVPHAPELAAVLLTLLAAGCYDDDCHDCGSGGDPYFYEREPNDAACCANYLGSLAPHESVAIRGSLPASVPDFFDGFAFQSAQPIDVRVELVSDDPHADFDVCIYDPLIGDFIACFETSAQPEVGLFSVLESGREFHVVVTPYSGSGWYSLFVDGYPISLPAPAIDGGAITVQGRPAEPREREHDLADYHPELAAVETRTERVERPALVDLIQVDDQGEIHRTRIWVRRPKDASGNDVDED